ncbi:MAG TPA: response regulator transcription factor [Dehalococcoidia bacterium]|nr:response regulator transcription factor [Dehalococcoidia bacterium]
MRVLLADDHALFRAGIAGLLRAWGMEVVGEASDGFEALAQARRLHPDLILMDIKMPRCNGLEATRLIKTEMPDVKIVIVTVSEEDDDLFEAIKSGAQGYLLKNMSEEEFSRTITSIAAGEAPFSRGVAAKILDEFARLAREPRAKESEEDELTAREREVLQLVAGGSTNREIGACLYVTESTVNFHMKNILSKLHLKNRAQAIAYAIRTGLVNLPPSTAD